ncbi:hypothetical protein [Algoriphagus sp.]|uniref:hypothetical protein n=1 Tax=Algoriphagus sp. TaxID=1872435 RepID=UPI003F6E8127
MGFFGGNIVRLRNYEYQQWVKERLRELAEFSPDELDHIHAVSKVPTDEIMDVLEKLYDSELTYLEKVELLEDEPRALRILIVFTTMNRQITK